MKGLSIMGEAVVGDNAGMIGHLERWKGMRELCKQS